MDAMMTPAARRRTADRDALRVCYGMRRLVAAVGAASLTGCSLSLPNGSGRADLVMGYVAHDAARQLTRRIAPGMDLRLGGAWPGLNVGVAEQTVVYETPAVGVPAGAPAGVGTREGLRFAAPLGVRWRAADGVRRWLGWVMVGSDGGPEPTRFVADAYAGASLLWSPAAAGLRLGLGRATLLPAPADGTHALSFRSRDPERTTFTRLEAIDDRTDP